jgi:hypothetical protein
MAQALGYCLHDNHKWARSRPRARCGSEGDLRFEKSTERNAMSKTHINPYPSQLEAWRDQPDDSFEFEINREDPETDRLISMDAMDWLSSEMVRFVVARMLRYLADNPGGAMERLNVTLRVEVV